MDSVIIIRQICLLRYLQCCCYEGWGMGLYEGHVSRAPLIEACASLFWAPLNLLYYWVEYTQF